MQYIVKVGDRHVVECNGVKYEISEEDRDGSFRCCDITVTKDLLISTYNKQHLTTIVLVVQMVQLVQEQEI
ncbi:hypothetical protein VPBG_00106 [Vibrio phage helene 12B3]|uniref:hypothetical protein n=1 Tax=Vibrio phage helene 12B3 TaxID=573173 RepID=UPI0002C0B797|nr:hypothetical protein VPBG_00106 [Vibrio phage helene 12B3]YP_009222978.1 hypothetical protein VPLG_00129 [Vibrio phage eugene 12A10]AGG57878.1 hypothetical protein VPBG_00106 [Vibrio phage helene 12B3]AGN51568.1 hypothetical protein VPLG_00129 [Vibrio phage eugene 12A10]